MAIYWDVMQVSLVPGETYAIDVVFRDGLAGRIYCESGFFRGVFSHLIHPDEFRRVMAVDGVVTWPGNLDLAPDAMYHQIKQHGVWRLDH